MTTSVEDRPRICVNPDHPDILYAEPPAAQCTQKNLRSDNALIISDTLDHLQNYHDLY